MSFGEGVSGMVRKEMMCRKSSGGRRGEGGGEHLLLVEGWWVRSRYLEGSGNAGDCGDLKACTSLVGEVIIEREGDCKCNPGAVGMSVMVMELVSEVRRV